MAAVVWRVEGGEKNQAIEAEATLLAAEEQNSAVVEELVVARQASEAVEKNVGRENELIMKTMTMTN